VRIDRMLHGKPLRHLAVPMAQDAMTAFVRALREARGGPGGFDGGQSSARSRTDYSRGPRGRRKGEGGGRRRSALSSCQMWWEHCRRRSRKR
jgi:hypothetical protein